MIRRNAKSTTVGTLSHRAWRRGVRHRLARAGQAGPGDDLAAIRARLAQLEDRLHKAEALRDVKRLQYSYAHYAESGLWMDLGDLFATNGVAHYVQGDY